MAFLPLFFKISSLPPLEFPGLSPSADAQKQNKAFRTFVGDFCRDVHALDSPYSQRPVASEYRSSNRNRENIDHDWQANIDGLIDTQARGVDHFIRRFCPTFSKPDAVTVKSWMSTQLSGLLLESPHLQPPPAYNPEALKADIKTVFGALFSMLRDGETSPRTVSISSGQLELLPLLKPSPTASRSPSRLSMTPEPSPTPTSPRPFHLPPLGTDIPRPLSQASSEGIASPRLFEKSPLPPAVSPTPDTRVTLNSAPALHLETLGSKSTFMHIDHSSQSEGLMKALDMKPSDLKHTPIRTTPQTYSLPRSSHADDLKACPNTRKSLIAANKLFRKYAEPLSKALGADPTQAEADQSELKHLAHDTICKLTSLGDQPLDDHEIKTMLLAITQMKAQGFPSDQIVPFISSFHRGQAVLCEVSDVTVRRVICTRTGDYDAVDPTSTQLEKTVEHGVGNFWTYLKPETGETGGGANRTNASVLYSWTPERDAMLSVPVKSAPLLMFVGAIAPQGMTDESLQLIPNGGATQLVPTPDAKAALKQQVADGHCTVTGIKSATETHKLSQAEQDAHYKKHGTVWKDIQGVQAKYTDYFQNPERVQSQLAKLRAKRSTITKAIYASLPKGEKSFKTQDIYSATAQAGVHTLLGLSSPQDIEPLVLVDIWRGVELELGTSDSHTKAAMGLLFDIMHIFGSVATFAPIPETATAAVNIAGSKGAEKMMEAVLRRFPDKDVYAVTREDGATQTLEQREHSKRMAAIGHAKAGLDKLTKVTKWGTLIPGLGRFLTIPDLVKDTLSMIEHGHEIYHNASRASKAVLRSPSPPESPPSSKTLHRARRSLPAVQSGNNPAEDHSHV